MMWRIGLYKSLTFGSPFCQSPSLSSLMDPTASPSFDGTRGALEIGIVGCAFLFGITTVQVYLYHRTYTGDSRFLKSLVATVWLLELTHTIVTAHAVYFETIKNSANPLLLTTMPLSLAVSLLVEALITFLTEGFFTYRIFVMYSTPLIAVGLWFLIFLRLVASVAYFAVCFLPVSIAEPFNVFEEKWSWLVEVPQAMGAAIDILIALALCTYYLRHKESDIASTRILIDKLISWAVSTGLLTSVVSLLTLIFFITMKDNLAWIVTYLWLAKVYSNSLLASLNARNGMRETANHGLSYKGPSKTQVTDRSIQFARPINVESQTESSVLDSDESQKPPSLNTNV
ncbi:hypothetical protein FB45DRAFT_29626 [Roridomyces roridus]|uniref:DUF6534 domain-containing protein n=1 Tax=Roridomyces roridus TaxID=1738132 RepID=A0AAD7G1S6_9AGAR|nr:hypothetical protein FB45DRAFT_29626 [Roridomyces roridus]